jgi:hypothetical protein
MATCPTQNEYCSRGRALAWLTAWPCASLLPDARYRHHERLPAEHAWGQHGYRGFRQSGYVDAVKVRPREAADQASARAFPVRRNSLR